MYRQRKPRKLAHQKRITRSFSTLWIIDLENNGKLSRGEFDPFSKTYRLPQGRKPYALLRTILSSKP